MTPAFEEISMASLHRDIAIDAHPDRVWAAVRDFGALQRLAPGFVRDVRLDGEARVVTFANGNIARELQVDCDEARRRLVYTVVSKRVTHYNASVQVLGDQVPGDGKARSRLIWTIDLLPNDIAPYIAGQMDQGALAMQQALAGLRT
jgi:carbon monoxide dehydrogenase subunit G